ncbi:hypothetical protein MYA_1453 [Burkholderia sp. KJ006]|nr:hypothetical protein MYA_1453 [Burkholderia sp. KJ006]
MWAGAVARKAPRRRGAGDGRATKQAPRGARVVAVRPNLRARPLRTAA